MNRKDTQSCLGVVAAIAVVSSALACSKKNEAPNLAELSKKPIEEQLRIAGKRVQPCVDDWLAAQMALLESDNLADLEVADVEASRLEMDALLKSSRTKPGTGKALVSAFDDDAYSVRAVVECWNESPCAAFALCAVSRIDARDTARFEEDSRKIEEERRAQEAERLHDEDMIIYVNPREE